MSVRSFTLLQPPAPISIGMTDCTAVIHQQSIAILVDLYRAAALKYLSGFISDAR